MKILRIVGLFAMFVGMMACLPGCEDSPDDDPVPDPAITTPSGSGGGDSGGSSNGGTELLPGSPDISITDVPPLGSSGKASGRVSGVVPVDYKVAMYLRVNGAWWVKPYFGSTIHINSDGTWSASLTTGGNDVNGGTEVAVFLVPASTDVPQLSGASSLPSFPGCPSASKAR